MKEDLKSTIIHSIKWQYEIECYNPVRNFGRILDMQIKVSEALYEATLEIDMIQRGGNSKSKLLLLLCHPNVLPTTARQSQHALQLPIRFHPPPRMFPRGAWIRICQGP